MAKVQRMEARESQESRGLCGLKWVLMRMRLSVLNMSSLGGHVDLYSPTGFLFLVVISVRLVNDLDIDPFGRFWYTTVVAASLCLGIDIGPRGADDVVAPICPGGLYGWPCYGVSTTI